MKFSRRFFLYGCLLVCLVISGSIFWYYYQVGRSIGQFRPKQNKQVVDQSCAGLERLKKAGGDSGETDNQNPTNGGPYFFRASIDGETKVFLGDIDDGVPHGWVTSVTTHFIRQGTFCSIWIEGRDEDYQTNGEYIQIHIENSDLVAGTRKGQLSYRSDSFWFQSDCDFTFSVDTDLYGDLRGSAICRDMVGNERLSPGQSRTISDIEFTIKMKGILRGME
ncbi:MAG: hypothetical protein V1738_03695 [Patescibacteria group bacterium]